MPTASPPRLIPENTGYFRRFRRASLRWVLSMWIYFITEDSRYFYSRCGCKEPDHSVLRLFTGLAEAAFRVWVLIVNSAINKIRRMGRMNNRGPMGTLNA